MFTFTPPPVEPEAAPTNIKASIKSTPPWLREDWSTEAKPAVRAVTDWNAAISARVGPSAPAKAWSASKNQKAIPPPAKRSSVTVKAILE